MPVVACPRCGKRLTVSDWAPPILTCPDCLGRVDNPRDDHTAAGAPPPLPRRVIPLEYQARDDARLGAYTLFVLAALLGGAAWITLSMSMFRKIGIAVAVVFVLVLVTAVLQVRYPYSAGVQQASWAVRDIARTVLVILLILFGVVLLLIGTCWAIISGASYFG